jgi:hypothetical protein
MDGVYTHRMNRRPLAVVAAALLIVSPSIAFAWGSEGHRIVAEIAEHYLEPATAAQVRQLLVLDGSTTLADVSTWADDIRPQRYETARWHFVNIPIHPPEGSLAAYDAARDCPHGDCVVAKIDELAAVLHDTAVEPRRRLEALKFVVHLVADIHQPLHCADDGDRGGNDVRVTFLGRSTNLHAVWDTAILAAAIGGDERSYALRLTREISPDKAEAWRRGSSAEWATESYGLARQFIYGEWPHEPGALPSSYETVALPLADQQLQKAGVRLASVLNAVLK